ncbi:MAG: aminoacyl-tRNA hydrolase [Bacteroidetes bacterium]|nr:aminoacyl-tRNA hydrolase [Bacteroidota bacterium]
MTKSFNPELLLNEVTFKATTSGGKGGQNVNKVATKVELYFNVSASKILDEEQKEILLLKLESRITDSGVFRLTSSEKRTQLENKDGVKKKFINLINKSLAKPKPRKKTKPSKASSEERIKEKKLTGEKKKSRAKIS